MTGRADHVQSLAVSASVTRTLKSAKEIAIEATVSNQTGDSVLLNAGKHYEHRRRARRSVNFEIPSERDDIYNGALGLSSRSDCRREPRPQPVGKTRYTLECFTRRALTVFGSTK